MKALVEACRKRKPEPELKIHYVAEEGFESLLTDEDADPYEYVISVNINRRHLTTAQKVELIAALLKAEPERSDRATAAIARVDHKTVAAKRQTLEAGGEIPHQEKRTGSDGKAQPAKKKRVQASKSEAEPTASLSSPMPPEKPIPTNPDQLEMFAQSANSVSVSVSQPTASECSAGIASSPPPQGSEFVGASDNAVSMRIPRDPKKAAAVIGKRWSVQEIRDLIDALAKYTSDAVSAAT
jgi:hypothetical protein